MYSGSRLKKLTRSKIVCWIRVTSKVLLLAVLAAVFPINSFAASRGLSVELRASEAPNAPVAEAVELYANSYALIIGNDDYVNGWPKLSNAIKDAEIVATELEKKGFEVELYRNLDSDGLSSAFKKFFILKGDDPSARLFVWFAGHGATIDGEGYLIPTDAPVPNDGPQFKFLSVALRDFGTYMRQSVSKHVYAVFDSCFAGTVFSSQRALPPSAITRATTLPVRQFLTSGDEDQEVSDDGAFRELFVRAINGEERSDANGDGYVTASELGIFLGDRVTNLTQSQQTPRYGKLRDKNFDRGDFVFRLPNGPSATAVTSSPAAVNDGAEVAFWDSVKDSDNVKEFDAYLMQFPQGSFAGLARIKKSSLQQKLAAAKQRTRPREAFKIAFLDRDLQATKTANIREIPFPTAKRVGRLSPGDRVWGVGQTETKGGTWYKVARDGTDLGFVYAPLLASVGNIDEIIGIEPLVRPMPAGAESISVQQTASLAQPDQADGFEEAAKEEVGSLVEAPEPTTTDDRLSFLVDDLIEETTLSANEQVLDEAPTASADAEFSGQQQASAVEAAAVNTAAVDTAVTSSANEIALVVDVGSELLEVEKTELDTTQENLAQDYSFQDSALQDNTLQDSATEYEAPQSETTSAQVDAKVASIEMASEEIVPKQTTGQVLQTENITPSASPEPSQAVSRGQVLSNAVEQAEAQLAEARKRELEFRGQANSTGLSQTSPIAVEKKADSVVAEQTVSAAATSAVEKVIQKPPPPSQVVQTAATDAGLQAQREVSAYLRRYIDAAESGNSKAQFSLGYIYETGQEVEKNVSEAIRWYSVAAEANEIQAMIRLGLLYENGNDISKDLTEAAYWYRKAASEGHADAQQTIGYMYENGLGVIKDPAEAARWYERAATQGRVAAQNNLGRLYQLGIGVERNLDSAIFWYEKAASQGSEAARNNLADLIPGR